MGIRAFIFSGYPQQKKCQIFGSKVLLQRKTCSMSEVYGRMPRGVPVTPLEQGVRR